MESPSHSPSKFHAQSPPPKPRQTLLEINLAPGEPVPPGFEGEVQGVTQIQSKLDKFNDAPLIGLEYLVELLYFEDGREPQYICILCDKRGDPRTVMAHLTSYNHRLKYIDTHFHSVSKQMSSYRTNRNYRRGCQTLVANIAEYIEKRFGRLAPHACEKEAFEKKREHYTQTIVRDVHFSDKNGETFEEFVKEEYFESPTGMPQVNEPPVPGCKSASVEPKKRSPSPPVVSAPGFKKKPTPRDDRRNLSPVSSVSSSSLSDSPLRSRSRSASRNRLLYQHNRRYPFRRTSSRERVRSRSRNRRYGGSRSRSPSPRGRRFGGRESYQSRYKPGYSGQTRPRSDFVLDRRSNKALATESARWEEYRREMTKIEKDLEAVLHSHEKNPEKHPQYPEEWKKFWNRRYKELQAEHKDPAKHDFKPEWIEFWNKRMHELHEIEVKAKKEFLRKRLNLPEEPPQPIKFRINSKKTAPSGGKPTKSSPEPEIILIDDSKTSDEEFERITPDKFETTKRSHSPWEDDFSRKASRERSRDRSLDRDRSRTRDRSRDRARDFERARDLNRIRELERSRDFERSRDLYSGKRELYVGHRPPYERSMYSVPVYKKIEEENEGPMNVVAVLRLLTALEEKLGSLGPKVIDMLSQALALEKAEANSSETLLDNDVNCVLFETVKEKLKGQLLAGMIDACAEKPAKNAVKQIASLLHMASERKREKEKIEKEQGIRPQPVSVPGVGAVDKSAIAKQIATALVQQGRTDVTQAELEQLINAVVGMAEVSQKTGAPVSTADYVNQLKVSSTAPVQKNATNEKRTEDNSSGTALQILQNAYNEPSNNAMDGLSDSDLETLLQNFKDLSTDEQHRLITYLKKLEAKEPERVERLRKFVNLGPTSQENEDTRVMSKDRESPFSTRLNELNSERTSVPEKAEIPAYVKIDSEDDDDYSFEDVFKAASKNLKEKQLAKEQERRLAEESMKSKTDDPNAVLKDAKMLIANLMGQLGQKNVNSSSSSNLLGFPLSEQNPRIVPGPISAESSSRIKPSIPVTNERLPPIANPNSQYGAPTNQFPGYSDYSNQSHDQYAGYRKQSDYPQQSYNNYDGNNGNYQRHFDDYNNYNSNYNPPGPPAGNQDFNNYPVDMYGNYSQNNYNQGANPSTYGNPPRGYNNQQRYF